MMLEYPVSLKSSPGAELPTGTDYRSYVRGQIQSLMETLTQVMFGDFTVVARTPEPDEDFGYLCAMVNVAISAARNAQAELSCANERLQAAQAALEQRVNERTKELQQEIAERRRAEEALRVQEERTRRMVETAFDGIVGADNEGKVLEWNAQAEAIFGWSAAEAVGRQIAELIIPERFRDAHGAGVRRFPVTGEGPILNRRIEVVGQHKDGREIPVELAITPVRVGKDYVFNAIARDITSRKRAEAQLLEAHKQLVDLSREAGMAEVATGVLHNVGNVLNSVNVSANLLADSLESSEAAALSRVVAVLRAHGHDLGEFVTQHPQGKHLTEYLDQLDQALSAERSAAVEELTALREHIEHIKDIVAMQQNYAKVVGVQQQIKVTELIEDSLRLNAAALGRHQIEIVREFLQEVVVNVDKHKVLQILVNLVSNAKYACVESHSADKRVTIRIAADDRLVKILVTDNGIGITPENLTRIFCHGFTTRPTGHGFGLHSGALAARELGGTLTAHSDGPGKGATFVLELPLQ